MHPLRNPTLAFAAALAVPLALTPDTHAQTRNYDIAWMRDQGATINGELVGDRVGDVITAAGDMNGDGFDDIVVTAWRRENAGLFNTGRAWIVYGGLGLPGSTIGVDDPSVTELLPDFTQDDGFSGPEFGASASTAGDVDGDGFDDVIIGSPRADPNGTDSGIAYIIYGSSSMPATIDCGALGSAGVELHGASGGDLAGISVSGGGDVDGDGFDDVIVGAQGADPNGSASGAVYVVYGGSSLPNVLDLGDLSTISGLGVVLEGIAASDRLGETCAFAGDFDDDGFGDVLAGAPDADPNGKTNAGSAYLLFGGPALPDVLDMASLGTAGVTINGPTGGFNVADALGEPGDVNGDGFDDVMLGAPFVDTTNGADSGRVWVVFGSDTLSGTLELGTLGTGGIVIDGASADDNAGSAVSCGGDVNRDGFDDMAIGAQIADPSGASNAGQVAVIFGGSALPTSIDLSSFGSLGAVLDGIASQDLVGSDVDLSGDFDADGFDDVLFGARQADPSGTANAGSTYLLKGACNWAQVPGPAEEGVSIPMRSFGAPGVPFQLFVAFDSLATPQNTKFGPWSLQGPVFPILVLPYNAIGEFDIVFPFPPSSPSVVGLDVFMHFLQSPQGDKCDLSNLVAFTVE